ncbi:MAG: hypothetical protein IKD93_03865 [Firmicutes bacterium]|nr:hypothetical protein [Bacillota bacterium]
MTATHVFLTGEIQVGKSTAIGRALELLGRPPVGGFRTVSLPCPEIPRARFAVYVLPGALPYRDPLREEELPGFPFDRDHLVAIRWGDSLHTTFPAAFRSGGLPLLEQDPPGTKLLLMDEIGVFEAGAPEFCAAIARRLEGELPVLGVVKHKPGGFLEQVRRHPRVRLLTVTRDNREDIPQQIADVLRPQLDKD